jgi:hypothetical protein
MIGGGRNSGLKIVLSLTSSREIERKYKYSSYLKIKLTFKKILTQLLSL